MRWNRSRRGCQIKYITKKNFMGLRSNFFYDFYHLYIILGCLIKENKNQKMAGTQVNSGYFLTGIRRVKKDYKEINKITYFSLFYTFL